MLGQLKILFLMCISFIAPFVFYKFTRFILKAFLKEEQSWKKWKLIMDVNIMVIVLIYMLGVVTVGRNLLADYLTDPPKAEGLQHSTMNLQETTSNSLASEVHVKEGNQLGALLQKPSVPSIKRQEPKTKIKQPKKHRPTLNGTIRMGKSKKFVANWAPIGKGLQVVRLGPGPLKHAGIKVGDRLQSLDGLPLINEKRLLKSRDSIFEGDKVSSIITVERNNRLLQFKLIK